MSSADLSDMEIADVPLDSLDSLAFDLVNSNACNRNYPSALGLAVHKGTLHGSVNSLFNGLPVTVSALFGVVC